MVTIPKTHKAVATPAPRAPLVLLDRDTEAPGPGEVLIHNEWTASSPLDLHRADGGLLCHHPEVMGGGAAGTVVASGPGTEHRLRPGDRVFYFAFHDFRERAHQDFATVPEYLVSALPGNVRPEEAVTVPTNLITVFHSVTADLGLELPWPRPSGWEPRERDAPVLVWGAASSVGVYAVQVLRYWGYDNVIAVASEKHHAYLREIGARETFSYRDADVVPRVLEAVGEDGVPFVLDCIGSVEGTLRPLTKIARRGTKVAIMLPVIVRDATEEVEPEYEMDVGNVLVGEWDEGVELRGVRTHFYLANEFFKEKMQREIVPKLLEDGIIKPNRQKIVEGETMLERAQKAIELLRKRDPSGERLVWRVSDLKL
ncbi:zinc-binding dehydrogenase [Colletotrichum karsti]|uniref:Zinc-binding dehydrogenase n=1 Tax=Colletotrichum karsti TaxID=1095194 RepID=A0A9P6I9M5_9PEZI|nr:zinc-binding dehydrogenase [Colletotrichum karsti]KAF9876501.1 zinc-binding dehydrogenase [Colletotrichum karsti]